MLTRRSFVGSSLPAALAARAYGANDRIRIGIIGAGNRGRALMKEIEKARDLNVAVTAICDIWRPNRERAVEEAKKAWGAAPRSTADYQELLSWDSIDAVVISAPDFTHSIMLKHAVEAGKDAYCEKPMGVVFSEAKAAYLAVKRTGRVVQIGTQRRSDGRYIAAAKLVRSGALGKVTRVETSVNFFQPRWRRSFEDVKPEDLDWDRFYLGRPKRPFDPRRFRQWQLFREFTNGIPGLWMSHFIDLVPWFLGDPYPAGAVAKGGVYYWKDGRETYDVFHALLDYPTEVLVEFAMSLTNSEGNRNRWHGSRGTLDMDRFVLSGAGSKAEDRIEKPIEIQPEPVNSHMANFIECVRSRGRPRADIEAGFSHAVAGCMAALARDTVRNIRFDAERLEIVS